MKKYLFCSLSILLLFMHPGCILFMHPDFTQECGIEVGTLVIKGGGPRNSAIVQAIKDNMGGESGPLVLIPTAKESEPDVDERIQKWIDLGFTDVSVLHTRDPAEANTEEFIQPLLKAKAVFMGGGRQWRLADSYNGTRTLVELKNLLLRGGVIAGSSAGATIQGSFLPRGDEDGSKIMISNEPEHLIGFGFIPNVAFDVHVNERDRWTDLYEVLEYDNTLLGIGISKSTAIVVKGKTFSIVGAGKVAVYTWDEVKDCAPDGECYLLLEEGDWYDLCKREQTEEPVRVPVHPATRSSVTDADR